MKVTNILLIFLLLALVPCDAWFRRRCRYKGKIIKGGKQFKPNPCRSCKCPRKGGRVRCSRIPCPFPSCVDAVTQRGQCCPICPNGPNCRAGDTIIPAGKDVTVGNMVCRCDYTQAICRPNGCLYKNDIYPPDSIIPTGPCEHCVCPPEGGQYYCAIMDCAPPPCVDSQTAPDQCCPTCPNGPSCYLDGRVIPGDQDVRDGNRVCRCPEFSFGVPEVQALCEVEVTVPPGCQHDGKMYPMGETFYPNGDPCMFCHCTKESTEAVCAIIDCGLPPCVDAVRPEGQCCATCPNGPNCYLGDDVIEAGKDVPHNGGTCRCPEPQMGFGTRPSEDQAVCVLPAPQPVS